MPDFDADSGAGSQIADNIRTYGAGIKLHSQMVCGGVNIRPQIRHLARGTNILVATPGRLLDLLGQVRCVSIP